MYANKAELPSTIQDVLPVEAQELYLDIYNETWQTCHERGESPTECNMVAHRTAWNTVNQDFVEVADDDGHPRWYRRGEEPTEEEQASEPQGVLQRIKNIF